MCLLDFLSRINELLLSFGRLKWLCTRHTIIINIIIIIVIINVIVVAVVVVVVDLPALACLHP